MSENNSDEQFDFSFQNIIGIVVCFSHHITFSKNFGEEINAFSRNLYIIYL